MTDNSFGDIAQDINLGDLLKDKTNTADDLDRLALELPTLFPGALYLDFDLLLRTGIVLKEIARRMREQDLATLGDWVESFDGDTSLLS